MTHRLAYGADQPSRPRQAQRSTTKVATTTGPRPRSCRSATKPDVDHPARIATRLGRRDQAEGFTPVHCNAEGCLRDVDMGSGSADRHHDQAAAVCLIISEQKGLSIGLRYPRVGMLGDSICPAKRATAASAAPSVGGEEAMPRLPAVAAEGRTAARTARRLAPVPQPALATRPPPTRRRPPGGAAGPARPPCRLTQVTQRLAHEPAQAARRPLTQLVQPSGGHAGGSRRPAGR